MTGRERLLTAICNGKPDRMPCQVHTWMEYYLNTYLGGTDQFGAYDYFNMDQVIYADPIKNYHEKQLLNWQVERKESICAENGCLTSDYTVKTPGGILTYTEQKNEYTQWVTKHIIENEDDFEIWQKYYPRPSSVDWTPIIEIKDRIGDRGIIRGAFYDFGQCSPWQSFSSVLFGAENSILACFDKPDWVHYVLNCLLERKLEVIKMAGDFHMDLIECGGGGGSSTVISPDMHKEFCLPYDQKQIKAFHDQGAKVVYHLCGGLMPLLETVAENGADALETMTPPEMGGDCILSEATRRVGDRLAFIGGFNQNDGFERGTPEVIRKMVFDLHAACPDGGYICSPSDHFFFGDPENIRAFVEAARECTY